MRLHDVWREGAWIEHPNVGALVVTCGELSISLVAPSDGFLLRWDLEERYPGDEWAYHPKSPIKP